MQGKTFSQESVNLRHSCLNMRLLSERRKSVCVCMRTVSICVGARTCRCVTFSMQNVSAWAYRALHARTLSLQNCMCVSVCAGYVHASRLSMCAGTPTQRPCRTGPQCVRPDAKSTWQKQIMSAPVIFSSPSALQEPFKGPNTAKKKKKITHTDLCIYYACTQYGHMQHHAEQHLQNEASAHQKNKSDVTFLTVTDIQACAQTCHLKPKRPFTPWFTHPEVFLFLLDWHKVLRTERRHQVEAESILTIWATK